MAAFLFSNSSTNRFERSDLADGFSESWLQDLLFREPGLLPLQQVEPGAGKFIPVCRELPLPRAGGNVFLDVFGITQSGRPILVECKLWRNPQARREVIAQILEYSALLRRWSYSDLIARLRKLNGWQGQNPLYELARTQGAELSEADFVDAVSRNLRSGDFHLIIVGDGIREDASAIVEHVAGQGARLALVEMQRWKDDAGNQLIVPLIPFRTEVIRQRILVDAAGTPLIAEREDDVLEEEVLGVVDIEKQAARTANREFWQSYLDAVRFDHPDQPPPRHGGNNWVKVPMPEPARWLNVYRFRGRAAMSLVEREGSGLLDWLARSGATLQNEFGPEPIIFQREGHPVGAMICVVQPQAGEDQLPWLLDATNRMTTALRARIAEFKGETLV